MQCSECSAPIRPVVSLDIDGTIGDYHSHFHQFAEAYVNRPLGEREAIHVGFQKHPISTIRRPYDYSEEFSEWLGMEKNEYRAVKLAYRQGGMKRTMPIDTRASVMVDLLQRQGAEVWFATTRPWMRLDNIDPDTRHWLERHGIRPDGLIYGDDKYHQLVECVSKERIVAVMDDLPEQLNAASALGLHAVQRVRHHVRDLVRAPAVLDMDQAYDHIQERLEAWRKAQQ